MKEQLFYTKRVNRYQKWKYNYARKEDFKHLLKQHKTKKKAVQKTIPTYGKVTYTQEYIL